MKTRIISLINADLFYMDQVTSWGQHFEIAWLFALYQ